MRTMKVAAVVLAAITQQAGAQAGPTIAGTPRTAGPAAPGPVPQRAPVNGVLILYGNERCPTDREGNEVIVCERRSADEQFRVPKEIREFAVTPENQSWARAAQGTLAAGEGASTQGSCSTVGVAGASGCFIQQSRNNRETNQARNAQARQAP